MELNRSKFLIPNHNNSKYTTNELQMKELNSKQLLAQSNLKVISEETDND